MPLALGKFNDRDTQEVNYFRIMRTMSLASKQTLSLEPTGKVRFTLPFSLLLSI